MDRMGAAAPDGLRVAALLAGLAIYALFSAPAPPLPGLAEAGVALMLLAAMGFGPVAALATGYAGRAHEAGRVPPVVLGAFACLLWLPLLRGAIDGAAPADIVRDVVPLITLFLPVLLAPLLMRHSDALPALTVGIAAIGIVFAGRYLAIVEDWGGWERPALHLVYLPNDPSVLFGAIWLPLVALDRFARRRLIALAAAAGGALCFTALVLSLQRAAIGAACLAIAIDLARRCGRRPALLLVLPVVALAVWIIAGELIGGIVDALALKTRLLGFNQHDAEIGVALGGAGESLGQLLFGSGWGALIETPAVPGVRVRYLHSFPLYLLAKAGLIGLAAMLLYLGTLVGAAAPHRRRDPALFVAILAPLAVAMTLHTGFKYLSCGLLLTVLWAGFQGFRPVPADKGS